MICRLGHALLILALLGATGGHWAFLQSVAWTKMVVDQSRTAPLTIALAKTFSGRNPCQLCKRIETGKQSEQKRDLPLTVAKLEFFYAPVLVKFFPPQSFDLVPARDMHGSSRGDSPPVPPPRSPLG